METKPQVRLMRYGTVGKVASAEIVGMDTVAGMIAGMSFELG